MKSFLLRVVATAIAVPMQGAVVSFLIGVSQAEFGTPRPLPIPHTVVLLLLFGVLIGSIWTQHGSFARRVAAWAAGTIWLAMALFVVRPLTASASQRGLEEHGISSFEFVWPAAVFYAIAALAVFVPTLVLHRPRQQTATGSQSMGFFSNMRLAGRLRKISEALSAPVRGFSNIEDIKEMVARGRQRAAAEEELLDFLEGLKWMSDVKAEYGLAREALRSLFRDLHSGGCGQWVRGRYVAASAPATPQTLIYVLEARRRSVPRIEMLHQLLEYFEGGKVEPPPLPK